MKVEMLQARHGALRTGGYDFLISLLYYRLALIFNLENTDVKNRHDALCTAGYDYLVWLYRYRLIRISNLGNTDVRILFSLPRHPTWSHIELNDGSWEFALPLSHISKFRNLVRKACSNAKIDVEYNPLRVPEHDAEYFESIPRARYMNQFWLQERAEKICGYPKSFYMALVRIANLPCDTSGGNNTSRDDNMFSELVQVPPPVQHQAFQILLQGPRPYGKVDCHPLSVPDHDVTYFGFPAAHSLNGTWLEERVEYIYGTPKYFYMILICIQKLISAFMDIVPLSV
ncbi:Hypothetical protein PENO1_104960 [Penicillium occitanis (nom. inval.)]|nr:Hypothetical protein PENO1_104960 [Penicillium occitanis (nom. inval.)]PCG89686.1 hypothetical protein PENOC_105450 [Penicillium occitanis (nom. inval.)]